MLDDSKERRGIRATEFLQVLDVQPPLKSITAHASWEAVQGVEVGIRLMEGERAGKAGHRGSAGEQGHQLYQCSPGVHIWTAQLQPC